MKFCLIASCYLSAWSILYFVQLLPSVGHFVNIVQRMQVILVNFIVVYTILLFPFPHVFLVLLKEEDHCELEGFETLSAGFYSVFKVMVNMLDFRQTYGISGKYMHLFIVSFVTNISLLLLVLLNTLQLATGATGLFSQGVTAVVHGCFVCALGHNLGEEIVLSWLPSRRVLRAQGNTPDFIVELFIVRFSVYTLTTLH